MGDSPVHPRSRGEHDTTLPPSTLRDGSSPLARGTQLRRAWHRLPERFIPARAGNTHSCPAPRPDSPVHPRSRGEHVVQGLGHGGLIRFIPARAGNTTPPSPPPPSATVHPRSRGEHFRMVLLLNAPSGSSPLARGTRPVGPRGGRGARFIPARAGNTLSSRSGTASTTVHPRSRGEHRSARYTMPGWNGSSPLARGTRGGAPDRGRRDRFIPARAGNTSCRRTTGTARPVHPRSRGEHPIRSSICESFFGSSPLARGTQVATVARVVPLRFIPARAGNT